MSIKITHRESWLDHQNMICMACNTMAVMKIEVRVTGAKGKEFGPAQTLRLCRTHADITSGMLIDELAEETDVGQYMDGPN